MLHETLDHDLLEKYQNLLPFESDNTITYRLSLHFQCVPMWQDVVRLIKEFGILLLVKVKIHTLAFANREGPLMVFHKGLINSNYWTTIVANLVSFSFLQISHWIFKSVCIVPFIQDLCLCIGFTKVLIFTFQLFQTCSMSTLESASCPHVQDRVLQEANILNNERLVKN